MNESVLAEVAHILRRARSVLVITGAGVSADSGVPTYRGVGGLYDDAETEDGMPIEEALSGAMFRRDPALCWKYIARIEAACRGVRPNRAHEVIAELEDRLDRVCVLTQNVDGLHVTAGSRNVLEIHGTVHRIHCPGCGAGRSVRDYSGLELPPRCAGCGAVERPDVVLFGEMLPVDVLRELDGELAQGFDVVMSVGTTAVFPYIASPIHAARALGTPAIEINPGRSEVSALCSHRLVMGAAAAFDELSRRL